MSLRQLSFDRKRVALPAALVAGAIATPLAGCGEEESPRDPGTERSGAEKKGEPPKAKPGKAADTGGPEGASRGGSKRARGDSSGGDSRGGVKLPRDLVKELRRRKIPVIELKPGQRGGLPGGKPPDPRELRKLLEPKKK